jgi:thiol-disulfide isomerase/thioredoxin
VRRAVLVSLVGCLLLAGCATAGGSGTGGDASTEHSSVKVDTASLRSIKHQAGVEPCATGTASSKLPERTLPCLGGGPAVKLSTLKGPLVINLFAQWCGPCRSELPYYQQLHEKTKGTLTVLGIDYLDTRPDLALRLVEETGVTYPLLADPDGVLRRDFGVRGLPGVVLVKPDGSVDVQLRVFRSYDELRRVVEQGLGVTIPA